MWKGVTDFLENVDQKAAEYAQQREDEGSSPFPPVTRPSFAPQADAEDDEDWDLEGGDEETVDAGPRSPSSRAEGAPLVALPPPPQVLPMKILGGGVDDSSNDVEVLKQQVANLTRRMGEAQRAHEREGGARDKAFMALQGDYEAMVAKNRGLAIEIEHWQAKGAALEERASGLEMRLQRAEGEASDIRAQRHAEASESERWEMQCNEQLVQLEEQRRELTTARAHARKMSDGAAVLQSELDDYKLRSKITLDEKDRAIETLTKTVESLQHIHAGGGARELSVSPVDVVPQGESAPSDQRSSAAIEELELALRQSEARVRALAEQLQQKTNEVAKAEESLRAGQLLNAQMKELLDGEHATRTASAKAFEARLAEKQAVIVNLEKRAGQLQGHATISGDAAASSNPDLERRAKELAQLLMEKQSALESKRAEADQWRTRYEVSQQRLREAELVSTALHRGGEGAASRRNLSAQRYGDLSSAEAQDPSESVGKHRLMTQLASKGGIGARVVGVADQVDRFSLKAGGMLRQHSLLRVFLVCYVIVLQLYMFIVTSVSTSIPVGNAHEGVPVK